MKILVTPTSLQPGKNEEALASLRDYADELVFNPYGRPLSEEELIPLLSDCDGYIAGLDRITARALASAPGLKAISRYGVGYDRVDIQAARELGIPVANTPGVNSEAVGELAFGLLLTAARSISYLDRSTRSGGWIRSTGIELMGKTLGICGLGSIGKVVARCAKGFGMKVIAYDPYINTEFCKENNIGIVSFDDLLEQSDAISLHLPLMEDTVHIFDASAFDRMKTGSILVNTSRGGIIDEDAAYDALISGKLGSLALDAFETEPPLGSKLLELDQVIATPHTGAHTIEATDKMACAAIDNLKLLLNGAECRFVVN